MLPPNRPQITAARRIVVKLGTAIVSSDGRFAASRVTGILEQISELRRSDSRVVLVTSGAVGLGRQRLGLQGTTLVDRQACAAVGQSILMSLYDQLLRGLDTTCAQILLTQGDFLDRPRYLNLSNTIDRLLQLGCLPIINENDTVSTLELELNAEQVFGDNDKLSALVAAGIDAEALVILTNVPGILTRPPGDPDATRIATFLPETQVTTNHPGAVSKTGRGGVAAKIAAARLAAAAGVPTIVADGREPGILLSVLRGDDVGTLFPADPQLNKRKRWLAFATAPSAEMTINAGARRAVVEQRASLLPRGITVLKGDFAAGAVVRIVDEDNLEIARGVCRLSSSELRQLMSQPTGTRHRPAVHRDDIAVLVDAKIFNFPGR